jgi:metallophosphoesterase superfamily enzyme
MDNYPEIEKILVRGNHELYGDHIYTELGFKVIPKFSDGRFIFTHEPIEEPEEGKYNICGHIHPAVSLHGKANQSIRTACFYFGKNMGILPAFGTFTGTSTIRPKQGDRVFAILENKVLKIGA